ncbi:MAG: ABC transporter substrate-binding protein, partial [Chloroflexota bacterium]
MSRKLYISVFLLVVSAIVLSACAAEPVVETVVVTQEVIVTEEVEVVVTQEVVVTEEVEVVVEATPVAGRCAPISADEVETIKIGATVPQSAPGAVAGGLAMQNAINIAVAQLNEAGGVLGKEVDVVFYDTASLPERGTAGMEYLITQECVAGVVGEYHSSAGVAMKEISNKYHIPTV